MATPSGIQGLLQSLQPWMNGGSSGLLSDQYGGTSGLMDAMLQAGGPDTTFSRMGAALTNQKGLALDEAAKRQQLAQGAMGLQVKAAMLPMQLAMMRRYYGGMLPGQGAPQGGAQPQSAPQGQPQAQPVSQQTASAPDPFSIPTPQQIGSIPIGGMPPGYGSMWAFMNNKDPVAAATAEHDAQVKLAQQQYGPILARLDTLDKAQSPSQYVKASPALQAKWQEIAPTLGFDPVKDFSDSNVRTAFSFLRNKLAGALGEPTVAPPVQMRNVTGPYGYRGQIDPVTLKETPVQGRALPTFSKVGERYNTDTNSSTAVFEQTGGWFGGGGGGSGNPGGSPTVTAQGGAPRGPANVDLGMPKPSDAELKAAMFGSEMRAGLQTLNNLENKGFTLSPKTRALVINAATSEEPGILSQLLSQEALSHGMSPQEQEYVAALMPMLQAAGHDQSGARLTTAQIRQNVESLLPINVRNRAALQQIQKNRQGFYDGLLTQAGSAAQLPQYRQTLGSDLRAAQAPKTAPANALAYLKQHPELAPQFRAKYGYLPNG